MQFYNYEKSYFHGLADYEYPSGKEVCGGYRGEEEAAESCKDERKVWEIEVFWKKVEKKFGIRRKSCTFAAEIPLG